MSDFLTRLIHRTQGSPMVVQPLVVSRFARGPEQDTWAGEAESNAPPTAAAPSAPGPPAKSQVGGEASTGALAEPDVADPEQVAGGRRSQRPGPSGSHEDVRSGGAPREELWQPDLNGSHDALAAASPGRWNLPPASAPETPAPEPLIVPWPPRAEFFPPTPATGTGDYVDQDRSPWEETPDSRVATRSFRHIGIRRGPGNQPAPPRQPHSEGPSYGTPGKTAEPPLVQVTIGRVEVRAILEAPPQPRSVPPPSPKMSLETYLQQGKEGRR